MVSVDLFSLPVSSVQSMATAVAQLFMALPHSPSTWSLQHTGVVCMVKDNPQRSYFIRMFDLKVLFTCRHTDTTSLTSTITHLLFLPPPTGREADMGAGALQPDSLLLASAVLPHLPCRCKSHPGYTRVCILYIYVCTLLLRRVCRALQDCLAGLNFAKEQEANLFQQAIQEKISQRNNSQGLVFNHHYLTLTV